MDPKSDLQTTTGDTGVDPKDTQTPDVPPATDTADQPPPAQPDPAAQDAPAAVNPELLDPAIIDQYIAQQQELLEKTKEEIGQSPHILPEKDRAEGALTRGFLRFVGEKPDFVRKDEVGEHIAEALFLGLPVGLTTYGISSYLGAWGFLAAAGTSASLIMAAKAMAIVLPTAAAIYMLDSSILKSIKNYGLDKYIELRKIIDDGKKDADMVAKNLAAADTLKDKAKRTMEGGSFLMFNGSLLARFVLSSAFAIVTTAKIVDVSLHSQDVDAIIVERDHQIQKELEEGPGLSRDEIIAEKKGELDEAKSELALHKGEVEKLESQLTGAVSVHLSEAEKARIAALEGDISKLSTELQEQQKLRQQHIDVRSQEEHTGTETSNKKAGRGSEWRLADGRVKAADEEIARLENQIRIKTADIDRINDGARQAAVAAAANESEVRAGRKDDLDRARERVQAAEAKVASLEDYRAHAENDPRFRELDLNERRFSALWEVLTKSGDGADYIMAGGIAASIMLAETSYIINKLSQKIPHGASLRTRYHEMYTAEKEAKIHDIQERINFFERMKEKIAAIRPAASAQAQDTAEKAEAVKIKDSAKALEDAAKLTATQRQDAQNRLLESQKAVQAEILEFIKTGKFASMSPVEQKDIRILVEQLKGVILTTENTIAQQARTNALNNETSALNAATRSLGANIEALRALDEADEKMKKLRAERSPANDDNDPSTSPVVLANEGPAAERV